MGGGKATRATLHTAATKILWARGRHARTDKEESERGSGHEKVHRRGHISTPHMLLTHKINRRNGGSSGHNLANKKTFTRCDAKKWKRHFPRSLVIVAQCANAGRLPRARPRALGRTEHHDQITGEYANRGNTKQAITDEHDRSVAPCDVAIWPATSRGRTHLRFLTDENNRLRG